jgi:hypothetical protein
MMGRRPLTLPTTFLALVGLGLIVIGFLMAVPPASRTAVAFLDLVVLSLVYLVILFTLPLHWPSTEAFSREIPGLGVLWGLEGLYMSLAIGGIWYGWAGMPFRLQLWYHLAVNFAFLIALTIAGRASEYAEKVATVEQRRRDSLQGVKAAMADCEGAFLRLGDTWTSEYSAFQRIKDDVRYLSPCDAVNAVSLDLEIAWALGELSTAISVPSQVGAAGQDLPALIDRRNVREIMTRCQALVRLRKQERQ